MQVGGAAARTADFPGTSTSEDEVAAAEVDRHLSFASTPPTPHSMTSSARAKTGADMSKPSARAALRFAVNLNSVGC